MPMSQIWLHERWKKLLCHVDPDRLLGELHCLNTRHAGKESLVLLSGVVNTLEIVEAADKEKRTSP